MSCLVILDTEGRSINCLLAILMTISLISTMTNMKESSTKNSKFLTKTGVNVIARIEGGEVSQLGGITWEYSWNKYACFYPNTNF